MRVDGLVLKASEVIGGGTSIVLPAPYLDVFEIQSKAFRGEGAREAARARAKELRRGGWEVAVRRVGFSDLARNEGYFLGAVRVRR